MNRNTPTHRRILAIAASTCGFGFAVMENESLIEWGLTRIKDVKRSRGKVEKLMSQYTPAMLVLPDLAKPARPSRRIRALTKTLTDLARRRKIKVKLITGQEVKRTFSPDGKGTKRVVAEALARRYPEELGPRLPRPRKPWMSEDPRMDLFAAVALAAQCVRSRK